MKRWALLAGVAVASVICAFDVSAQGAGGGAGGGGGGRRGGFRGGNFDPAQFQQMRVDRAREALEITDDSEWNAIRPLVEGVYTAQTDTFAFGRGGFGRRGRGGRGGNGGGGRGFRGFGQPNPAVEALNTAIDSGSTDQIKAALDKYRAARKEAEDKLTAAQDKLKAVLKVKQEAIALEMGLVN